MGPGEETVIGYDRGTGEIYVDRTRSGLTDFSPSFPSVSRAPVTVGADGLVRLRVVVDRSSVEVFAQDGEAAITSAVYPSPDATGVSLFSEGGSASVTGITIRALGSYRDPAPSPSPAPSPGPSDQPAPPDPATPSGFPPAAPTTAAGTPPATAGSRPLASTGAPVTIGVLLGGALLLATGLVLVRRRRG